MYLGRRQTVYHFYKKSVKNNSKCEKEDYFNGNFKLNGVSDDWDCVPRCKEVETVPFTTYDFGTVLPADTLELEGKWMWNFGSGSHLN